MTLNNAKSATAVLIRSLLDNRGLRRRAKRSIATALTLLLTVVTLPFAVRGDDSKQATPWDEVNREMRDLHEAQVRYEEQQWMDERVADMRAAWDALDEMKADAENSFLSSIPRPPIVGPRYSSNSFGASYEVPYGRYSGDALVGLVEVTRQDSPGATPIPFHRSITTGQQGLRHLNSGWTFEPGGMLKETYNLVSADVSSTVPGFVTQCKVADRFEYVKPNGGGGMQFLNKGIEETCNFTIQNQGPESCAMSAPGFCNASRPTKYWSTNGQVLLDVTNINTPVLTYPDATQEVVKQKASGAYVPFNQGLFDSVGGSVFISGTWFTDKIYTRNGYITRYQYDPGTGWVTAVIDPKGRETDYIRDGNGRITTIKAQGHGGVSLQWQLTWSTFNWNPAATFPDIQCLGGENFVIACTNNLSYTTLTSLQIPDGRRYQFTYTPAGSSAPGWGNLYSVTTPEGAVNAFDYGNSNTQWISAPRFGGVPDYTDKLDKRHLASTTVYPSGLTQQGFTTRMDFDQTETLTTDPNAMCGQLNWIKRTYPDGNFMREAQCAAIRTGFPSLCGRTFAQEVWQGNQRLQATYYGNIGHIGDSTTLRGNMYLDYEEASTPNGANIDLDVRPTKVVHNKDGVQWIETYDYDFSAIPVAPRCSGCSSFRTTGNIIDGRILDGAGNLLARTATSYWASSRSNYNNRNLIRLPETVRLIDASGTTLMRTDYLYDEYTVIPSGAANLDTTIGIRRGDQTTVTQYKDAQSGGGPVSVHKHYFDSGDLQQAFDAKNYPTTMTYDFNVCSTSHPTLTNTVRNAKNHLTTTVSDCYSGNALRVIDPNNQSTYTQYDDLGRVVETAGPGDKLSSLPLAVNGAVPVPGSPTYVRDASAPLSGVASVGSNGNGPTAWTDYLSLGVVNQQRVVSHIKDGSGDGHYVKTFIDGLSRTIQVRTEVDPATSGGNAEVVATTEYDSLGRVSKNYVPVFSSAANAFAVPGGGALSTVTTYDPLARTLSVQQPGVPAVLTRYTGSGSLFLATLTDARGNQTISYTDILGHKVRLQQQSPNCTDPLAPGWCVTQLAYDAAGRLLTITDPAWNQTTYSYDSLGRKKGMTDPDMGTWSYDYDDNGNLIYQRDARGQIINMTYDLLNRLKVKDLAPNGPTPGAEDTTYSYDGE